MNTTFNTLDYWFGTAEIKEKLSKQKNIFYFDFNTMESKWLSRQPKDITFSTIVKWKKMPIKLCTNLQQNDYKMPLESRYDKKHISFLKSNLQKCIRRKLNNKAIKTAYHFMKLNINGFLRRISIIMIEDVVLHESFSTIVWLMAATQSIKSVFQINKNIVDWLLGIVNILCDIDHCDDIGKSNTVYDITEFGDYELLYSLQFRLAYGGMNGDMDMLNHITGVWLDRFKNNIQCNKTEIKLIDSSCIGGLIANDWKLEGMNCAGIDFHCAPQIVETLAKMYNRYSENEIKGAIWNCSSRINYRKVNDNSEKDIEIWNTIEIELYKLQQNVLNFTQQYK